MRCGLKTTKIKYRFAETACMQFIRCGLLLQMSYVASVCVLVVCYAKPAELIEIGRLTRMGPRNHGVDIPPREEAIFGSFPAH